MVTLPGGFSPTNAIKQLGSYVNPTGGVTDYDVFNEVTFQGGDRNPKYPAGNLFGLNFGGQSNSPNVLGASNAAPAVSNTANAVVDALPWGTSASKESSTDPYAQWGGLGAFNNLASGFNNQLSNIGATANSAAKLTGGQVNRSILDFIDSSTSAQNKINQSAEENFANKISGNRAVGATVDRGISSGNVMLANRNAGSSSGGEAIARAYGQIGQRQNATIGNQFAKGQAQIDLSQADLETQMASGVRNISGGLDDSAAMIVEDARKELGILEAAQLEADMPTRISIEVEKQKIKQSVLGYLSKYDQQLTQGVSKVNPTNMDTRRDNAFASVDAGRLPEESFNLPIGAGAQFQTNSNGGDTGLPIYTSPSKKDEV